jgi:hypothetical protein
MRTTDLNHIGETSQTRLKGSHLRHARKHYTIYISYKKRTPQQQLHLRRNIDQAQTGATKEGRIADGSQRGRQEHFAQRRIEIEGVLETKK